MARILLGVSGGIAAYKAVELVRLATRGGHAVRVVQTATSERFVGRETFVAVTGAPVLVDDFEPDPARGAFPGERPPDHRPISHLELVERADAVVVAPASANTLARLAHGFADDLLTSAALAASGPLVLAPAMNGRMWAHPATRANLATLTARGAHVVAPDTGPLASRGEWGTGRLAEPAAILAAVEGVLAAASAGEAGAADAEEGDAAHAGQGGAAHAGEAGPLAGVRLLVTAGGTREPIDAVRFVGNRSSGRMGFAVADEAARRGAAVTVVAANVDLDRRADVDYVDVATAAELDAAAERAFADADVLVMAAAVADFRPAAAAADKIAKAGRDGLAIELEPTRDVLAALSERRRPDQTLVGFAAETGGDGLARARDKLVRKGLDRVVLNDVAAPGIGFEATDNEVTIVAAEHERRVPRASKAEVARAIVDEIEAERAQRLRSRGAPEAKKEEQAR